MLDTVLRLSRDEYRRWAEQQPRGRFERIDGQIVPMTPERLTHALLKAAVWRALDDAVRAARISAQTFPDGVTVEVDADTDYEPDALVNLGVQPWVDEVAAPQPVIVVEVLSRGTQSVDTGEKLAGYFKVASIVHYLVVSARRRQVIHHRRAGDRIVSSIVTAGHLQMEPPGLTLDIEAIYRGSGL